MRYGSDDHELLTCQLDAMPSNSNPIIMQIQRCWHEVAKAVDVAEQLDE
jgi:hypothetical protein